MHPQVQKVTHLLIPMSSVLQMEQQICRHRLPQCKGESLIPASLRNGIESISPRFRSFHAMTPIRLNETSTLKEAQTHISVESRQRFTLLNIPALLNPSVQAPVSWQIPKYPELLASKT